MSIHETNWPVQFHWGTQSATGYSTKKGQKRKMEEEERPRKLQKLENGKGSPAPSNTEVEDLAGTTTAASPPTTDSNCVENGKLPSTGNNSVIEDLSGESDPAGNTNTSVLGDDGQPLSKNAIKRQKRKQKWEDSRDFRKQKRKEKVAEKKAKRRAEYAAGTTGINSNNGTTDSTERANGRPSKHLHSKLLPITLLLDCDFDDYMLDKERISLSSQLTRCYSDNRQAPWRANLVVASFGGKLKERFETVLGNTHKGWKGVKFTDKDFVAASEEAKEWMKSKYGGEISGALAAMVHPTLEEGVTDESNKNNEPIGQAAPEANLEADKAVEGEKFAHNSDESNDSTGRPAPMSKPETDNVVEGEKVEDNPNKNESSERPALYDKSEPDKIMEGEIVYLSSESPNTLTELKPYSTYIVGGLVDHNRHKGICHKRAVEKGVKTAKLPIGDYLKMSSRYVLATNHVVEIMLKWLEYGDWGEAFIKVVPKRKGGVLKKSDDLKSDENPKPGGGVPDTTGNSDEGRIDGVLGGEDSESEEAFEKLPTPGMPQKVKDCEIPQI